MTPKSPQPDPPMFDPAMGRFLRGDELLRRRALEIVRLVKALSQQIEEAEKAGLCVVLEHEVVPLQTTGKRTRNLHTLRVEVLRPIA